MAKPPGVIAVNATSRSGAYWIERCFIQLSQIACYHEHLENGVSTVMIELSNGEWYHIRDSLDEFEAKWNNEVS